LVSTDTASNRELSAISGAQYTEQNGPNQKVTPEISLC